MVYLFYGEDTYSIAKKTKEWIEKFSEKESEFNVDQLEGETLTKENFARVIMALPFLGSKRLIVIKNFLLKSKDKDLKDYISQNLEKIPETTVLLFVEEGMPDARTSLFKKLSKGKTAKIFSNPLPNALKNWILSKFKDEGFSAGNNAIITLQTHVGADLWRLDQEIAKLILFAKAKNRTEVLAEDVEALVQAENNSNIFEFTDALAKKDSKQALEVFHRLLSKGEDCFFIFSMIVYQYRNMLAISDLIEKSFNQGQISKELRLRIFVVKKSISALNKYSAGELKNIYLKLQEIDIKTKSGLCDLESSLDFLIVNLCF